MAKENVLKQKKLRDLYTYVIICSHMWLETCGTSERIKHSVVIQDSKIHAACAAKIE